MIRVIREISGFNCFFRARAITGTWNHSTEFLRVFGVFRGRCCSRLSC